MKKFIKENFLHKQIEKLNKCKEDTHAATTLNVKQKLNKKRLTTFRKLFGNYREKEEQAQLNTLFFFSSYRRQRAALLKS